MKRAAALALAVALAAAVAACTHAPRPPAPARPTPRAEPHPSPEGEAPPAIAPAPTPAEPSAPEGEGIRPAPRTQVGLASFYSRRLEGRRTANGERYDGRALTCAHRSAPFGARLRVTELASGRSVVVRVNDRGPFVRGRVVDLSLAAARELGIVRRGLARVEVEFLAIPAP